MILTIATAHRLHKDTKRKLYDSNYFSEHAIFIDIVYHCVKSRTLHAKGSMQLLTHRTLLGLPYAMVPAAILIGYQLM